MGYESRIPEFKKLLSAKEETALKLIGELLEGKAKLLAPVGRVSGGTLRQSIGNRIFAGKDGIGVAIGSDLHYAIYVEKGTGMYAVGGDGRQDSWTYYEPLTGQYYLTEGMKPQAFLEPAVMKNVNEVKKIVEKVLGEIDDN